MKRWLAAEADGHDADDIRLQQLEEENRRLRKETADLEDTVDILKKAAAIFSQSQRKTRNNPRTQRGQAEYAALVI